MSAPDAVHVLRFDGEPLDDVPPLLALARPFVDGLVVEGKLSGPVLDAEVDLLVLEIPDDARHGMPRGLVLLLPRLGYLDVRIERAGEVVYKHPHPVAEVIGSALGEWLAKAHPGEPMAGFAVCPPGVRVVLRGRPAPPVEGAVDVSGAAAPRFSIRRLAEPPLDERRPSDFPVLADFVDDVAEPAGGSVQVLLDFAVHEALHATAFSPELEEGGFLLGRVYANPEGGHLVHVTAAVNAEHTGASLLHFAFTGDSFSAVKRVLSAERPGERLLGWYHTHLFAATESMGLSSVDLQLHFNTFRIPWQIAGLVNLSRKTPDMRVLRFYVREGKTMVRCPLVVLGVEA